MMKRGVMVRRATMLAVGVLLSVLAAAFGQTAPPPQAGATDQARVLTPGAPAVERELAGGGAHSYRVTLSAGQFLRVELEQRNIDVVVALRAPGGEALAEMDGLTSLTGTEELVWEAAAGGEYVLDVRSRVQTAAVGQYTVRVEVTAEAGGRGQAWIAAQRLFMDGRRAQAAGNAAGLERAAQAYAGAVERWREAGARRWEGQTLNYLGIVYENISQYERARDYFQRALEIRREVRDRQGEAATLNSLGIVYLELSQYERARDYYEQSLVISREVGNRQGEGNTLNNLGIVFLSQGQYERAREHYERALAIRREMRDRQGEGQSLTSLGNVHFYISQYERARDYYERALAIRREVGNRFSESVTLNNLGNVYLELSQYERARDYYEQSLVISREVGNRQGVQQILNNLGTVYENMGQYERARDYYEQSLVISREVGNRRGEGTYLSNLGTIYLLQGQYERARDYYERALTIRREIGDRRGEVNTLYRLARLASTRDDLTTARTHIEAALAIVESIRAKVASPESRSSFLASVQDYYSTYIDILMRLHEREPSDGHNIATLEASERGRARSLLDLLSEARANIRQGVDVQLVERERSLQRQLNARASAQQRLLGGRHTPEQAAAMEREIIALTNQYQDLQAQIRRSSPRYAALTQPQPLSVREIQSQVLDADTLLLEYSLGEERSYLWAVTQNSLTSHVLPRRSEVEAAARRVYELLTTRQPRPGETAAMRQQRVAAAEAEYTRAAASLSRMLLGSVSLLPRFRRVVVVADGALNYVPFAALPPPAASGDGTAALVDTHEVVSLPSASALAVLRRETQGRRPAARAVAVLADPVFSTDDERVRGAGSTTRVRQPPVAARGTQTHDQGVAATTTSPRSDVQLPEGLVRSLATTRGSASDSGTRTNLTRLIFSRREAETIYAAAPRGAALRALDFQASRETVTRPDLSQYRIVHFATHGLLNSQRPELSGVVLSLVDERGQPQDGFLRLHEVYNLNLPADLVVLSACQTGLGQEVRGEGLVGLTRGFMYAGAKRVVASLWQVDDMATAELMRRFYTKMLREGQTPAAALRAAQVELRGQRQWRSPYYWAGFVLQGEWR